jgi:hypothetical protein
MAHKPSTSMDANYKVVSACLRPTPPSLIALRALCHRVCWCFHRPMVLNNLRRLHPSLKAMMPLMPIATKIMLAILLGRLMDYKWHLSSRPPKTRTISARACGSGNPSKPSAVIPAMRSYMIALLVIGSPVAWWGGALRIIGAVSKSVGHLIVRGFW